MVHVFESVAYMVSGVPGYVAHSFSLPIYRLSNFNAKDN